VERRTPPGEDAPAETGGFESALAGAPDVSAIVAISEEDMAKPHDEQNLLVSSTSLEHDGQRIVQSSKRKTRYYNRIHTKQTD